MNGEQHQGLMSIETPEIKQIAINVIEVSGGTQSRAGLMTRR